MRPGIAVVSVVLAAAVLAFASAHRARAYQHISNGSFEDGFAGWAISSSDLATTSSESPAVGGASAKITGGAFAVRLDFALSGALAPGTYDISLQMRGASFATVTLSVTPSPQSRLQIDSSAASTNWNTIGGQFTLSTAAHTTLSIVVDAPPGADVYLDDVRLDGTSPVTLTPTPTRTPTPLPATTHAGGGSTPTTAVTTGTPPATATPSSVLDVIGPSLRNAGFEELDDTGAPFAWEKFGGSLASENRALSGARAARLDSATDSTKWLHQAVTVGGGNWYAFEASVLHGDPGVASAYLRISWYASSDGSGSALATADSIETLDAPSSNYRRLTTGAVLAPPEARSARTRVLLAPISSAQASILVDDAWFGAASPPPPTATSTTEPAHVSGSTDGASHSTVSTGSSRRQQALDRASPGDLNVPSSLSGSIVINEILYDADSEAPDTDAEWIELYNSSDQPHDLTGWTLRDGVAADVLPPLVIPARGFAIVAATSVFHDEYPGVAAPIVVLGGRIGNGLGNDGDALMLLDSSGAVVDTVSWGDDVSAFDPGVDDVPAGHSIEREFAGVDSNAAADFIDNERPSPGFGYEAAVNSKPQESGSSVRIIEGAEAGAFGWLPWALAAASAVACATTLGWRAFGLMRRPPQP